MANVYSQVDMQLCGRNMQIRRRDHVSQKLLSNMQLLSTNHRSCRPAAQI